MIRVFRVFVPLLLPKGCKATLDDTNFPESCVIAVDEGLKIKAQLHDTCFPYICVIALAEGLQGNTLACP